MLNYSEKRNQSKKRSIQLRYVSITSCKKKLFFIRNQFTESMNHILLQKACIEANRFPFYIDYCNDTHICCSECPFSAIVSYFIICMKIIYNEKYCASITISFHRKCDFLFPSLSHLLIFYL